MYRKKNLIQLLTALLIGLAGVVGTLLLLSQEASARPMLDEDNLSISKNQSSDYVQPGSQLVYTLTYQNTSTDTVSGIIITDTLDPNVSYASASLTPTIGVSNTLSWNIDDLAATASGQITLRVTITSPLASGTIITNSAAIDGAQTNLKTAEVTATVETATSITLAPATASITAGQSIPYTITAHGSYGNEWDVTGSGAYTITPDAGGTWATNIYTTEKDGDWTVTATYGSLIDTAALTVTNAAPTIEDVTQSTPANEGAAITVTITATDPGNDTLTYGFDWDGNGVFTDTGDIASQSSNQASHTWADDGAYTIIVRVDDNRGGVTTATAAITVNNVAPTITLSGDSSVNEGSVFALTLGAVADPGDDTVTEYIVHWGDASSDSFASAGVVTHTYADNDSSLSIIVDLVDEDGAHTNAGSHDLVVNNIPPTVDAGDDQTVDEGDLVSFSGSFTDPGSADTHDIRWTFGDGGSITGTLTPTHAYADDDPAYSVVLRVTDDDGGMDFDALWITVNNVPPSVDAGPDQNVNEGETVNFTGVFTDPGTADTHTILWDFGDGETATGDLAPSHAYADNGIYTVTLTVTDDDGGSGDDTLTVTVSNVAPIVDAGTNQVVDEADTVNFDGSFGDPGSGDTHDILWDFGDGITTTGTLSPSHIYTDNDIYTVTLTVSDDDGGSDDDTLTVTVNNVAPSVDAGPNQTVDEGDTVNFDGSFTDPGTADTHDVLWDFGDGVTTTGTLTPSHTYTDNDIYTVTLTVSDDDGDSGNDILTVTVNSVDPIVDAGSDQTANEGDTVSFSGSFTDPSPDDTYDILWDFGDGVTTTGTLSPSHIYADNDIYTVTLTVTDDDGGSGDDTLTVTVSNVDPTVDAGDNQTVDEGDLVNFSASLSDPGAGDTHDILWDFGDGVTTTGTLAPSHAYADNDIYTVTLTVTDDDGGSDDDTLTVTVSNVDPTVDAGPNQTVDEGGTVNFNGSLVDPGFGDTHTIIWNFGDGATVAGVLTPTHVYTEPTSIMVTLVITDDDGGVGSDAMTVTVENLAPNADAGGPYTGTAGLPVTMTAAASWDPGGGPLTYTWDLDDDGAYDDGDGAVVTYTWTVAGIHTVTVRVADAQQAVGTDSAQVSINPADLNHIVLTPLAATIYAWETQTYTVGAFDVYSNSRGDVTTQTAFSIVESGHGGHWTGNIYSPQNYGDWTVQAVHTGTIVTTDTASLTVLAPVMHLEKEDDPDIVEAGAILTYTLTYSNTGNLAASGVTITDTLDSNITFAGANPAPDGGAPDAPYWHIGDVAPNGPSPIIITATVARPLPNGTLLTNTAWLGADHVAPLSATEQTTVTSRPVLTISKESKPDPVVAGQNLVYTVIITNSGNENASSVTIVEEYDPNTSFVYASLPPDPGSDNQEWTFATLDVDDFIEMDIVVRVTDTLPVGTVLTNEVTLDSDQTTPISTTETTQVLSESILEVTYLLNEPNPVPAGDELTYLIQCKNTGSAPAYGVVITATYDSRVTYQGGTDPDVGDNVWNIGTLNAGYSDHIYVEVIVDTPLPNGSILANLVTVDSTGTAPIDFIETTMVTSSTDLAFSVAQQPANTVEAGAPLTYTLRYTNTGNASATQIVVTATFDSFAPFSSASPAPTGGTGDMRYWEIDVITGVNNYGEVNGVGEIIIQTDVTLPLTNGTPLSFTTQLEDAEGDFLEDTAQITVTSAPILSIDKNDGVSTVYAGDVLTYTLTYTNSGNENAYGITITDTLPVSYTQYITCEISGGTCQHVPADNEVVFHIPAIIAPTSGQAQLVLQVDDPLPSGANLVTNRATMTHPPSLSAPIDVQDVDLIGTLPDLTINAVHNPSIFSPGKLMNYTVIYGNVEHMHAKDVVITTTLPSGTIYEGYGWTSSDGQTYTYAIGDLLAGNTGNTITFTVRYSGSEPQEINASEFNTIFTIAEGGSAGGDANPGDNSSNAYIGVPDLAVLDFTVEPLTLEPNAPVTFTILIENQGTGMAWNPDNGGGFWVDIFTATVDSYPYERDGEFYGGSPPIAPGDTHTLVIAHAGFTKQQIQGIEEFYTKVDNHPQATYGLVPESNEMNNIGGPVSPSPSNYDIYLPLVQKNRGQ